MEQIVSLEEAVERSCSCIGESEEEYIIVDDAMGRVVSRDVYAILDVPHFNRSMVDGYALKSKDICVDSLSLISGDIAAGDEAVLEIKAGQAIKIMTGAMLPPGADAVIKQEDVSLLEESRIKLSVQAAEGQNVQNRGWVMCRGELIIARGQLIDPVCMEKMAVAGVMEIAVYKLPVVCIVNTGSELLSPGEMLRPGKIYPSNTIMLKGKLQREMCQMFSGVHEIPDNIDSMVERIKEGLVYADLLIVTGGTGHGKYDLHREVMKKIQADIVFSGIDIKPGPGTNAAVKNHKLIINLPGNPGAASILFEALVMPVIRKLKGISDYHNKWFNIKIDNDINVRQQRVISMGDLLEVNGEFKARLRKNDNYSAIKPLVLDIQSLEKKDISFVKAILL